jgi:hypothetical protein
MIFMQHMATLGTWGEGMRSPGARRRCRPARVSSSAAQPGFASRWDVGQALGRNVRYTDILIRLDGGSSEGCIQDVLCSCSSGVGPT